MVFWTVQCGANYIKYLSHNIITAIKKFFQTNQINILLLESGANKKDNLNDKDCPFPVNIMT